MSTFRRIQSKIREPLLRRADRQELAAAESELFSLRSHAPADEDFMAFLEQAEKRTARLRSVIAGYGQLSPAKLELAQEVLRDLRERKARGLYLGGPRRYVYALESSQARVAKIQTALSDQTQQGLTPAPLNEGTPC